MLLPLIWDCLGFILWPARRFGTATKYIQNIFLSGITKQGGGIAEFEAPATEKYVLKLGATGGLNMDVKIFKN